MSIEQGRVWTDQGLTAAIDQLVALIGNEVEELAGRYDKNVP